MSEFDKGLIICLFSNSGEKHLDFLEECDREGYIVHLFNNIGEERILEVDVNQLLIEITNNKVDLSKVFILSDNIQLLLDYYKNNSWNYCGFIYANDKVKGKEISFDDIYKLNFNFYTIYEDQAIKYGINLEGKVNFGYHVRKLENMIESAIDICNSEYKFREYYKYLEIKSNILKNELNDVDILKNEFEIILLSQLGEGKDLFNIYINSFLLNIFKKSEYLNNILKIVIKSRELDKNNSFFIFYQAMRFSFLNLESGDSETEALNDVIYDKVYKEFKEEVGEYKFINKQKRDKDLIFVFTSQFLSLSHAPTKTVLDRCYTLIKHMGKRVILINTKDFLSLNGIIPFHNTNIANEVKDYSKIANIEYKDISIPFYQSEVPMPEVNECINILNMVNKYKPYMIFTIGGNNILADLCSQIVPTATISTVFSSLPRTKGTFFVLGRLSREGDYKYLEKNGYRKEALIDSKFTFDFKEQKYKYIRQDFGIPDNKFVLVIIGARLQNEVSEEFLNVLNDMAKKDCFIVSIGGYTLGKGHRLKYRSLNDNFKDLGFQDDVLACAELIDIYLNPDRIGGGSSALECMFKGKPAISLNKGDVATAIGEEFLVADFDEMKERVEEYRNNKDFYKEMSIKAEERAKDLLDSKKYFKQIYSKIIHNPLFK